MSKTATSQNTPACPALSTFIQNLEMHISQNYGSQKRFAKALETSPTTVSQWLKGTTPPKMRDWYKLVDKKVFTLDELKALSLSFYRWRRERVSFDALKISHSFERMAAKAVKLLGNKVPLSDDERRLLAMAVAALSAGERIQKYGDETEQSA